MKIAIDFTTIGKNWKNNSFEGHGQQTYQPPFLLNGNQSNIGKLQPLQDAKENS